MKRLFILITFVCLGLSCYAYNIDTYRQSAKQPNNEESAKTSNSVETGKKREIKNIEEYFKYLSHEVQRNWTPYKANSNYEVTVQFVIHRNGSISELHIADTSLRDANSSALKAVRNGVPYQPLPQSFKKDQVTAQIVLTYNKQ